MKNSLKLEELLTTGTEVKEVIGGERWKILHGDTLKYVKAFKPGVFDAVITDPPYASGGTKQNERNRTTNQKYSSMKSGNALPDFDGDNKDQRSWTHWMAEWLYDVRKDCKPGAPICLFIDWRQYPSITDALQWAGWIWRGTAVWDKGNSRPQKGRFRQQAGMSDPRKGILDKAMEGRLQQMQILVAELRKENENLKSENQRLQKSLAKKELNVMKNLL